LRGYDVIVVGARCAGASTALLLARKGYRVLLVDKAAFPSDTISTHYIQPQGVQRLKRWGLLKEIRESGCPPIKKVSLFAGPAYLRSLFMDLGHDGETYCPRRTLLDNTLVRAAERAGAELREHFVVRHLIQNGTKVCGISGQTSQSKQVEEYATITIGADGVDSIVAASVGAESSRFVPMRTSYAYSYWENTGLSNAEIYFGRYRAVTAFPTNADKTCVTVVWPQQEAQTLQSEIEYNYEKTLRLFPRLYRRLEGHSRDHRIYRTTGQRANFIRKAYGPGWALVGDAGCHKDPLTAFGISDAFRDAEFLAKALDHAFCQRASFGDALRTYERQRNQAVTPLFEFTLEAADAMYKFSTAG
jgi:flavin-dependent dehydrogenase